MKNCLDKMSDIDRKSLDEEWYMQSLLESAQGKGLIHDHEIERLKYECLALLIRRAELYNSGDSSVLMEQAQSIMHSNLLTIGIWLKACPSPDDAITVLLTEPIEQIYHKGKKRIDGMLADAKVLHRRLLDQLVDTKNTFYTSTIEDGINGFFKLYAPDFQAQEIHITADYPPYNPLPRLTGIEFITAYLEALYYENKFCRFFSAEDLHHLLWAFEKGYPALLINIYEPVLLTAIGCILAKTEPHKLNVTPTGSEYLQTLFSAMTKKEVAETVENAAARLIQLFQCSDGLAQYMRESLPLITENILSKIEIAKHGQSSVRIFPAPTVIFCRQT